MSGWLFGLNKLIVRRRREAGYAGATAVTVVFAISVIGLRPSTTMWPSAVARAERFTESLVEVGTLTTQQLRVYSSSIPGAPAKIIEIVPEGRAVKPGDVLVRFDVMRFEQMLGGERAALRQAEAEAVRAEQDAELEVLRAAGEVDAAHQQVENAERALHNQTDGRGHVSLVEAEAAVAESSRALDQARKTGADLKGLLDQGFITRAELDRAEQALHSAEDQQRVVLTRRDALIRYEQPAAISRAESELTAAHDGLARQTGSLDARVAGRAAVKAGARSRVEGARGRIAVLIDQIERATIRADGPGLVVYRDLYFGNDHRKPQIGDEVFPNQPIIALPDSSQFVVETRIREIDLHKVAASQRVQVRVDAYPDLRLPATVESIGALAQEDTSRAGTKFFPLMAKLLTADPRLRTGMTARIEIQVSALASAIVVPLEAVFAERDQSYVVVNRFGRPERRKVKIAAANESEVAVAEGLNAGDTVLLVDPTGTAPPR
jgi:HlyD family secretion protein